MRTATSHWKRKRSGPPYVAVMRIIALIICLAGMALPLPAQSADSLSQVKKLYVETFGTWRSADTLRQSLIRQLTKSGSYQLVSEPGAADAVLRGTGEVWIKSYITSNSRNPSMNRQAVYSGYLSVEIVGRNKRTLWSYLVTPGRVIWTNVANDLAAKMVTALRSASETNAGAVAASPLHSLAATQLHGAGATFPVPLYLRWFQSFHIANPGVQFNYDAVGSAAGIEMLQRGEVDFAGSDASSPDTTNLKLGTGYWRIPVVLGAVVPIYNLPGLLEDLKFTPEMLAGIYLGKITKWNDPEIRRWNHSANLPDERIQVVHRSDGSGTTFTFSDYLAKVSPEWRDKLGTGYQLKWPIGVGKEGNSGVTAAVQDTTYSIGYVELVYAIRQQLPYGLVRNSSGVFVHANVDSVAEAARDNPDGRSSVPASITNPSRKGAYPIATYTWLIVPQQITDQAKRAALMGFLQWILTDGQRECSALAYTPLPKEVAEQQVEFVRTLMKTGGTAIK